MLCLPTYILALLLYKSIDLKTLYIDLLPSNKLIPLPAIVISLIYSILT